MDGWMGRRGFRSSTVSEVNGRETKTFVTLVLL